jgi:hypothetical protein
MCAEQGKKTQGEEESAEENYVFTPAELREIQNGVDRLRTSCRGEGGRFTISNKPMSQTGGKNNMRSACRVRMGWSVDIPPIQSQNR